MRATNFSSAMKFDHFLDQILHKSFEKAEMSEKHMQSQVLLASFFNNVLGQDPAKHSPCWNNRPQPPQQDCCLRFHSAALFTG